MTQPIAPTMLDRLTAALRLIVRAEFPQLTYFGLYEYSVQVASTKSVDCSPTDTTIGLKAITNVPLRASILGETVLPKVGARCLVQFVNGDPCRPVVVSCDPTPQTATVDATGTVNVGPSAESVSLAGGAGGTIVLNTPYSTYLGQSVIFIGTVTTLDAALATVFTALATHFTTISIDPIAAAACTVAATASTTAGSASGIYSGLVSGHETTSGTTKTVAE